MANSDDPRAASMAAEIVKAYRQGGATNSQAVGVEGNDSSDDRQAAEMAAAIIDTYRQYRNQVGA